MNNNERTCPKCGATVAEGNLFCTSCGTKLEEVSSTPPPLDNIPFQPAPEASAPASGIGTSSFGTSPTANTSAPASNTFAAAPSSSTSSPSTPPSAGMPYTAQPTPSSATPAQPAAPSSPGSYVPPSSYQAQSSATSPSAYTPPSSTGTAPASSYTPPASSSAPASAYTPPSSTGTPPASSYTPPASSSAPASSYTPPSSAGTPPASSYTPPASASAPASPYAPPSSTGTPPASSYTPPPSGGPAPAYQPQGPGAQPPAPPYASQYGATPPPPPPKKKKTGLFIGLGVLALVVVVGIIVGVNVFSSNNAKTEYNSLVARICASTSPNRVAGFRNEVDTFAQKNAKLVEDDLTKLLAACEEYKDAPEGDARYLDMIDEMESLSSSTNTQISACAGQLLDYVESEYDNYITYINNDSSTPPDAGGGSSTGDDYFHDESPWTLDNPDMVYEVTNVDGRLQIPLSMTNTSDKTITYFEIWFYCYDSAGKPITGDHGLTVDWIYFEESYKPGKRLTPNVDGHVNLFSFTDVDFVIPFVCYVEFSDGTTWGVSDINASMSEAYDYMDFFAEIFDAYALEYANS